MYIYIKGVTVRFGFDCVRISQIPSICQKQSNGDDGVYYIQPSLASDVSFVGREGKLYLHLRGAFCVVLALYQHCTLKDDISYLLPT